MKLYQKIATTIDTLNNIKAQLKVEIMKANELLAALNDTNVYIGSESVDDTINALAYQLMLLIRYEKIERTLK